MGSCANARENIITKLAIGMVIGIFLGLFYIQGLFFSALMKECSGLNGIQYLCLTLNKLHPLILGGIVCSIIFVVIAVVYCCAKGCHRLCIQNNSDEHPLLDA